MLCDEFRCWKWFLAVAFLVFVLSPYAYGDEAAIFRHRVNLQRFQALCRSKDPSPPIRVLIYGQSITAQPWAMRMMESIRLKYPSRQWVVENWCIGGHQAEYLVRTAEADLYPFNPDLVIFHAYGYIDAYRRLVESVRARTTADLLLLNDHYVSWDSLSTPGIGEWDGQVLPELALMNGACMADVRTPWKNYLLGNHLPISALISDSVHPNELGQNLMESLVSQYLTGPALIPVPDPFACGRARRMDITQLGDSTGRSRIVFQGNRVSARITANSGTAKILLDGQSPSAWISGGVHGRASAWPGGWWPCLLQIGARSPLRPENWRLRIEKLSGPNSFQYSVTGTLVGFDGSGSTDSIFQSESGRVLIRPEDWYWNALYSPLAPGMEFTWSTFATGVDSVGGRTESASSEWVDLVSNLKPGLHELVLQQTPDMALIKEVIVYNPSGDEIGTPGVLHRLQGSEGFEVVGLGNLEMSNSSGEWSVIPSQGNDVRRQAWVPYSDAAVKLLRVSR